MRTLSFIFGILTLFSLGSQAQISQEDSVREVFRRFSAAFVEADTATLSILLAPDYIHINGSSGSVLDRESWLTWIAKRRTEMNHGLLTIRTYDVRELIIRVNEQSAILTGIVHSTGERMGEQFITHVRFTNVWFEHDGKWQRALFHDSAIPAPLKTEE